MTAVLASARIGSTADESRTIRRGNDSVTVVGERDGWAEIVLRNGKRALVPASEIADDATPRDAPRAQSKPAPPAVNDPPSPHATVAEPTPLVTAPPPDAIAELRAEVTRLRGIVDELSTLREAATPPELAPRSWLTSEALTILGLTLVIGILLGGAVQRQRARRARSLRF